MILCKISLHFKMIIKINQINRKIILIKYIFNIQVEDSFSFKLKTSNEKNKNEFNNL